MPQTPACQVWEPEDGGGSLGQPGPCEWWWPGISGSSRAHTLSSKCLWWCSNELMHSKTHVKSSFNFPFLTFLKFFLSFYSPQNCQTAIAKTSWVTNLFCHHLYPIPAVSLRQCWAEVSCVTHVRWVLSAHHLTSNYQPSCHLLQHPSWGDPLLLTSGLQRTRVWAALLSNCNNQCKLQHLIWQHTWQMWTKESRMPDAF